MIVCYTGMSSQPAEERLESSSWYLGVVTGVRRAKGLVPKYTGGSADLSDDMLLCAAGACGVFRYAWRYISSWPWVIVTSLTPEPLDEVETDGYGRGTWGTNAHVGVRIEDLQKTRTRTNVYDLEAASDWCRAGRAVRRTPSSTFFDFLGPDAPRALGHLSRHVRPNRISMLIKDPSTRY